MKQIVILSYTIIVALFVGVFFLLSCDLDESYWPGCPIRIIGDESYTAPDEPGEGGKIERHCNDGEFTVCHVPRGNPDRSRTICVGSERSMEFHLRHGDSEGPCIFNGGDTDDDY